MPVREEQTYVTNITRYGLPFVVAIFYVTASLGFGFTADSTFQVLSSMKQDIFPSANAIPSPLWQFLLMAANGFQLNPLLASKVLGLVFSCVAILATYLASNEVLHDRLLAFCVSLAMGMQGWLLQTAPSGSALALAVALVFAGLFFMLRNEYVVAPFIIGLCTLVLWEAIWLLVPLFIDIWANSVSKRRSFKVMLSATLVFLGALLPWGLYAWSNGVTGLPSLFQVSELPRPSLPAVVLVSVLGLLGVVGIVLSLLSAKARVEVVRAHVGMLVFMVMLAFVGLIYESDVWLAVLPLIVAFAYLGLAHVLKRLGRERLLYSLAFVLTGLLLLQFQLDYYRVNKPAMAKAMKKENECQIVAAWLQTNVLATESIHAERPGILGYYTERFVTPLGNPEGVRGDIVVTSTQGLSGYSIAFRPRGVPEARTLQEEQCVVWRKQ